MRRLICPAQDHFIFLILLIISRTFILPDPDVGLSILVCDVEHTSFRLMSYYFTEACLSIICTANSCRVMSPDTESGASAYGHNRSLDHLQQGRAKYPGGDIDYVMLLEIKPNLFIESHTRHYSLGFKSLMRY